MARLGASKKKKSPRATELSQLKKEVQRLTEQLESRDRELSREHSATDCEQRDPGCHRKFADRPSAGAGFGCRECRAAMRRFRRADLAGERG